MIDLIASVIIIIVFSIFGIKILKKIINEVKIEKMKGKVAAYKDLLKTSYSIIKELTGSESSEENEEIYKKLNKFEIKALKKSFEYKRVLPEQINILTNKIRIYSLKKL